MARLLNPLGSLDPTDLTEDVGIRLSAWGRTCERFYTGSSDGKVKAWNVKAPKGSTFIRDVLSVSGGISAGAFSKDFSKLVIGDATGKVHLLSIDESDGEEDNRASKEIFRGKFPQKSGVLLKGVKLPKVIIPHQEPVSDEIEATAEAMAQLYLNEGQLTVHPDRVIGAIQGPNYAETRLFMVEAHQDRDPTQSLVPEWQATQQEITRRPQAPPNIPVLKSVGSAPDGLHQQNLRRNLDVKQLSPGIIKALKRDRIEYVPDESYDFQYEEAPDKIIFKDRGKRKTRKSLSTTHFVADAL